jgi:phosphoglycerate dehydrogenase-like enzyme
MKVVVAIYSTYQAWIVPESALDRLRAAFPEVEFVNAHDDREAVAALPDAEVAFSSIITPDMLSAARRLRWIHSPAAGVGGMLFPAMLARDVVITSSRGMHAETIAEHVIGVTLALFRRLQVAVLRQAQHRWTQDELSRPAPRLLRDATMGVVGLGAVGGAIARAAVALGMGVEGIRRRAGAAPPGVAAVHPPSALHARLPHWDVVVLAAPHTNETEGLIGAPELALMKRDAVLVNVSRGKLVREAALADALARNAIGGAALDVVEHEPLDPASPLWDLPNVILTPHVSGFRPDYWAAATDLFIENFRRYRGGKPLLNLVDKQAGY